REGMRMEFSETATAPITAAAEPTDLYYDPYDYEIDANPHPVWRRMRDEAPLYRNERYDFWALSRFNDVLEVLTDTKTYTSTRGDILEPIRANSEGGVYQQSLIFEDPPDHTVHRHLLSRVFTPRAVKRIEDRVRQ